jgi:hypothetical protein
MPDRREAQPVKLASVALRGRLPDFVSLKVSDLQVETAASIIILSDQ